MEKLVKKIREINKRLLELDFLLNLDSTSQFEKFWYIVELNELGKELVELKQERNDLEEELAFGDIW